MSTDGNRGLAPQRTRVAAIAAIAVLAAAGCASSPTSPASSGSAKANTVTVNLTPQGCAPKPARISAGEVTFNVANQDADAVTEAELRTADLTHILGEQENLTPGLSGAFTLDIQPGSYTISCPGASQSRWTLTVSGKATGASWQSNAQLTAAVAGYSSYVNQNVASLVTHTQAFCRAIGDGSMTQARLLYPKARVSYERIEPVAEIWGSLDTSIDGRWENPVTVKSQFTGFHRIEQLLWEDNTLAGAPELCAGLVRNEQQLLTLVRKAQYNPLELASGATDLRQRGRHLEDQRRGGTVLQHRPPGLPGQRGRGHEGRRSAPALPAEERPRPAVRDPAAGCRDQQADGQVPGQPGLRRHRLRRVLHRHRQPAPPARRGGQRAGRGHVHNLRPGQLTGTPAPSTTAAPGSCAAATPSPTASTRRPEPSWAACSSSPS